MPCGGGNSDQADDMSAAKRRRSLAGPDVDSERRERERQLGFRAVGLAVSKLAAPIVAKRGGGFLVRLKAEWATIVAPDWAVVAWPAALGRDGALKLRAVPAAALELQHRAPLLIERINLYFGRAAVTRLVLVQGTLPGTPEPRRRAVRFLNAGEAQALDRRLSQIADPQLRAALARLGTAVIGVAC
jgi:hypothetical protein